MAKADLWILTTNADVSQQSSYGVDLFLNINKSLFRLPMERAHLMNIKHKPYIIVHA